MKITGFEDFSTFGGWENFSFLKVTTDEGIVGWAEFNEARGRKGLTGLIHSMAEGLIGEDPRNVSRIDAMLYSQTRSTTGGLQSHAMAALINACLDIKAKALNIPVYELLGGAIRERLPVYWSHCGFFRARYGALFDGKVIPSPAVRTLDDIRQVGREVRERGFKALKTNLLIFDAQGVRAYSPGFGRGAGSPELNISDEIVDAFVAQLSAFRDGAGPQVRMMVDLNFNYKPEGLRRLAKAAEPFNLLWLEMDLYEPQALAGVRHSTSTPVASLEAIFGRRSLRPYLENHAVDVAIIDVQWNGMMEAMRMASMADAYEVNVASHCSSGPLSTLISSHFCCAIPNFRIMEIDVDEVPWRSRLLTRPYKIVDGEFHIPTGPGWGADIDEEIVRAHPAKP
ncbi:MAG: mandelate racemase/muconate lactonizing enzyme family protein [Betaproteobacteria bacterium]|nr:mandelate racemase/muconate lactonizing enzyme family protein [Betaproteobacteria bacterium]